MKMKKYIKPTTDISSAYIEEAIMGDSTTNNNSIPVIVGDGLPKIGDSSEILTPRNHLWDYEEEEEQ